MKKTAWGQRICVAAVSILLTMLVMPRPVSPAIKNIAVVMSAGTKMEDVQLSELMKLCNKGMGILMSGLTVSVATIVSPPESRRPSTFYPT